MFENRLLVIGKFFRSDLTVPAPKKVKKSVYREILQAVELPLTTPKVPNPNPPTGIDHLANIFHNSQTEDDLDINSTEIYYELTK